MKRKILLIAFFSVISAVFTGCGADVESNPSVNITGSADYSYKDGVMDDSANRTYALNVTVEDDIVLKHEYVGVNADRTDYVKIADELLENLNKTDCMNGCSIKCDKGEKQELNGKTYFKVLSREFSSAADIDNFMNTYLTDSIIAERYSNVTGGSAPCITDIDGSLYVLDSESSCGFSWVMNEGNPDITVNDSDDMSFTVSAAYENNDSVSYLNVSFTKENGYWKVNSISD